MLFARFLAENHLLMHPDGVAVSLEECEELAKAEGAPNGFVLAAKYASRMLPEVFRVDDVLLEIQFPPEQRIPLEKLLAGLPRETFVADDSLGWVYQFWQSKRKDEVNRSGEKIDARTLPVVTQLFTEHYMVQFLLHNTIGAWLVGQAFQPDNKSVRLESLTYLRRKEDGTPAGGTFDGWPKTLREFTLLDPCCGSGHFLVSAFHLLVPLRMHTDGLPPRAAADAVLRDNLFGLEIDPRCTQIAAFALALAAWKYPDGNGEPLGYRPLPPLNLACTGVAPQASAEEWLRLAEKSRSVKARAPLRERSEMLGREPVRDGLGRLHALFSQAPTIGSLIDPKELPADLITADYETLKPYLEAALTSEQTDDEARERAVAAAGMVKAAELLTREYTLVATNVPYLGRGKQHETLKSYCEKNYPDAKADLATCFVERCLEFCAPGGTAALVTPQNWLFLPGYKNLRAKLLRRHSWKIVARLGANAFQDMNFWAATTALVVLTSEGPSDVTGFTVLDVSSNKIREKKAEMLRGLVPCEFRFVSQTTQLKNPDARITLDSVESCALLNAYAYAPQGIKTGDDPRYRRSFWEVDRDGVRWRPFQGAGQNVGWVTGLDSIIDWSQGGEDFARLQGGAGWSREGVVLKLMGQPEVSFHIGALFDSNVTVIVPRQRNHLAAIWAYCSSDEYALQLKAAEQSAKINNATTAKVPFDLAHWQKVAAEKYPNGLPTPYSSDPTQWLFNGHPLGSHEPLQVAVARLLGYRWPRQTGSSFHDCPALGPDGLESFVAKEGMVCLPAVRGERPAAEGLLEVLQAAYGSEWSDALLHDLLTDAGSKPGASLDDWLRNSFFEQHCKQFHQRPFIWHIWDGRKDGFSCLVNYHLLDHVRLESLAYAYVGDWIRIQYAEAKAGKVGADLRLAAAQGLQEKLKLILAGEPPYDIFVRWKPLSEQAIGWNPDLNDGVRMNIRPFVQADILRKRPNIKWTKDRGKEPEREKDKYPWFWKGGKFVGDRVNDVHLTLAEKQAPRR
jgi:N-6 DNA Methylase